MMTQRRCPEGCHVRTFLVDDLRREFEDMGSFLDMQLRQMKNKREKEPLQRIKRGQEETITHLGSLCEELVDLGVFKRSKSNA